MAYYDEYSGQEVLTPEEEDEKRKREQQRQKELADTAVHTEERKVYGDGTQEITTKREITPEAQGIKAKPSIFENLGNAVAAMPENFARNLQQGVTNLQNAPANFAANVQGAMAPQQPQQTQAPAPKLNFDRNAYNASIAQQESGNRPDIGYHDRTKSTAAGLYGITAPAYADARRRDPSLPEDITQATPEQQTRAHNIITDNNARYLQQKGIEPNANILSAAHFLGAGGLHKFLTQTDEQGRPYISPQAQAANGGYDKAAAIINGRLGGAAVPASGATQRPPQAFPQEGVAVVGPNGVQGTMSMAPGPVSPEQADQQAQQFAQQFQQYASPEPVANSYDAFGNPVYSEAAAKLQGHVDKFASAQGNAMDMLKIHQDTNAPEWMRRQAGDEVAKMVTDTRNQKTAEDTLPTLSQNDLAKVAMKKSEGNSVGDWLQYLLFKHVGLTDLANEKGEQLGIGHKWEGAMNGEGQQGMIKYSANGRPLSGIKSDGSEMSRDELSAFATQSTQTKTLQTQAGQASNHIMTQMRDENQKLAANRMPPRYTDDEIMAAGRNAYNQTMRSRVGGGAPAGTAQGTTMAQTGNAPAGTTQGATSGVQAMIDKLRAQPGSASVQIARQKELDKISPEGIEAQAQRIASYQEKMPATGRGTLAGQVLSQRVAELNKDYDVNKFEAIKTQIQTAEKSWTGGGHNAKQIQQLDRAAGHIAEYEPVMDSLGNTQSPFFNKWMQEYQRQTGKAAPVDASAAGKIIADEVMKTVLGTGAGSAREREALQKDFSAANSPDQYRAIVARCKSLMGSQATALERQYKTDFKGREDFDTRIGPASKQILDIGRHADQQTAAKQAGLTNVPTPAEIQAEIKRRQGSK